MLAYKGLIEILKHWNKTQKDLIASNEYNLN